MTNVAVIGAGLIGRAWSIVFARAGFEVRLWDPAAPAIDAAMIFIADRLPELAQAGLLQEQPGAVLPRVRRAATLEDALEGADHVQENGPERVPEKQALFAELDRLAAPHQKRDGFVRFHLRGHANAASEWTLITLAYNCRRLNRLRAA